MAVVFYHNTYITWWCFFFFYMINYYFSIGSYKAVIATLHLQVPAGRLSHWHIDITSNCCIIIIIIIIIHISYYLISIFPSWPNIAVYNIILCQSKRAIYYYIIDHYNSNGHYYYNTLFNQKWYLLLLLYLSRTSNSYCEFIIFLYLSYALQLYYCGLYYSVLFSIFVASNKHLVTIYTMNPFIHISLITIHIGIYTRPSYHLHYLFLIGDPVHFHCVEHIHPIQYTKAYW